MTICWENIPYLGAIMLCIAGMVWIVSQMGALSV